MYIDEQNYVDKAEKVIQKLSNKQIPDDSRPKPMVTTSKIRNLLATTADIYNEIINYGAEELSDAIIGRIEYLRVRFAYEAGRDPLVKALVNEANILEVIRQIKGSRKNFILFNHYMEALVAFHKLYGGKDN